MPSHFCSFMAVSRDSRGRSRNQFSRQLLHVSALQDHDSQYHYTGPGSFLEATKILNTLASSNTNGPSFHVVVPSLPNFGFSSRVSKPGFGLRQYSEVCHKLMQSLGYKQYACQGGDWVRTLSCYTLPPKLTSLIGSHNQYFHRLAISRGNASTPPQFGHCYATPS